MNTIENEVENIEKAPETPLSKEVAANTSGINSERPITRTDQRMEVEVIDPEIRSRRDTRLCDPIVFESVHEQAEEEEKHPWPPIQPIKLSDETKREFLSGLEALDCRDVQTQAQKRIGLLLIGGYTEEEVEEMCKPKPIPIDKIHREIMELQERALKRYERERRREERERQLYN